MSDDFFLKSWLGSHATLHGRKRWYSFKSLEYFFRILVIMAKKERGVAPDMEKLAWCPQLEHVILPEEKQSHRISASDKAALRP